MGQQNSVLLGGGGMSGFGGHCVPFQCAESIGFDPQPVFVHQTKVELRNHVALARSQFEPFCRYPVILGHTGPRQVQISQIRLGPSIASFGCLLVPKDCLVRVGRHPPTALVQQTDVSLGVVVTSFGLGQPLLKCRGKIPGFIGRHTGGKVSVCRTGPQSQGNGGRS